MKLVLVVPSISSPGYSEDLAFITVETHIPSVFPDSHTIGVLLEFLLILEQAFSMSWSQLKPCYVYYLYMQTSPS